MRKIGIIFVATVLTPSLVLAWLAFRSLRDQELVIERQRVLLYEAAAQSVVKDIVEFFAYEQSQFGQAIESALVKENPLRLAETFDPAVMNMYGLADVGFAVTLEGRMLAPSLLDRAEARRFRLENEMFLTSRETAQVYWNGPKGPVNLSQLDDADRLRELRSEESTGPISARTGFRDLIGSERQGIVARYLQDTLALIIWYRSARDEQIVYGARLRLETVAEQIAKLLRVDSNVRDQIILALVDEKNEPVAISESGIPLQREAPFASVVSAEIGDYLPHWKVGVVLRNPANFQEAASSLRFVVGLLISVLVTAIVVGGWLIVADMNRELKLAGQRTDFVSNVSHELKTPLTSIRMFSEMLAEGRVNDSAKQRQFAAIIATETARLTRLINNVLDFSRMERGEKRYHFEQVDISEIVRRIVERYRPHLESAGFTVELSGSGSPVYVHSDSDALTQVLLNLISNAEKYSGARKEIVVQVVQPSPDRVEIRVSDRGRGVPRGLDQKIFEQFFRAHDSLAEGIQGAGLGLSLARQIARAHGGEIVYERREGGGSSFILQLPCANRIREASSNSGIRTASV